MKRGEYSGLSADEVWLTLLVDPESAFQNPEDYLHTFSAEDGVGYKLMAAIFDAKVC
jgi:hypothetical protein